MSKSPHCSAPGQARLSHPAWHSPPSTAEPCASLLLLPSVPRPLLAHSTLLLGRVLHQTVSVQGGLQAPPEAERRPQSCISLTRLSPLEKMPPRGEGGLEADRPSLLLKRPSLHSFVSLT